ncbi:hypothetical protein BDV09DRAFT_158804 [Aspergillus tetrazonus]
MQVQRRERGHPKTIQGDPQPLSAALRFIIACKIIRVWSKIGYVLSSALCQRLSRNSPECHIATGKGRR